MIKIVQILFFLSSTLANFEAFWITNYEDTKVKSPNLLQPKFKTQSQIDTWDLDIKAQGFFLEIMVELWKTWKGLTVPKWVLIVLPNIVTPNAPAFICPIYKSKPEKFWISMKKRLHWASVVPILETIRLSP